VGLDAAAEQLVAVIELAAKFTACGLALTDRGDGRVLVQLRDEHGIAAGEKVV
jgi:hypothetical protein